MRRKNMSDEPIDRAKIRDIIVFSYSEFRKKERTGMTRSQVVDDIVSKIKKELREDAD